MDIREYLGDIILIIILVVSTYLLLSGFHASQLLMAYGMGIALSVSGLFLIVHHKLLVIEHQVTARERMMRVSLEEISAHMAERYEGSVGRIEAIVSEVAKRVYR